MKLKTIKRKGWVRIGRKTYRIIAQGDTNQFITIPKDSGAVAGDRFVEFIDPEKNIHLMRETNLHTDD